MAHRLRYSASSIEVHRHLRVVSMMISYQLNHPPKTFWDHTSKSFREYHMRTHLMKSQFKRLLFTFAPKLEHKFQVSTFKLHNINRVLMVSIKSCLIKSLTDCKPAFTRYTCYCIVWRSNKLSRFVIELMLFGGLPWEQWLCCKLLWFL